MSSIRRLEHIGLGSARDRFEQTTPAHGTAVARLSVSTTVSSGRSYGGGDHEPALDHAGAVALYLCPGDPTGPSVEDESR